MKKIILFALSLILTVALAFGLSSCKKNPSNNSGSGNESPGESENTVTVELDRQNAKLCLGGSLILSANVENSSDAAEWSSSKTSVATVENGKVTAVGIGTATITAAVGDASASCVITVTDDVAVIKPYVSNVVVGRGQTYTLSVKTLFGGEEISGQTYSWSASGNSASAEYSENGDLATFRGDRIGTTQYTVSTTLFGLTFYTNVEVQVINVNNSLIVEGDGVIGKGANNYSVNLYMEETSTPNITLLYNDSVMAGVPLKWTAGDDSIATVSEDGTITACGIGETQLKCLVNGEFYVYFDVAVSRFEYVMDTEYTVETYDAALSLTDELLGTVASVTINGVEVFSSVNGADITLDKSKLAEFGIDGLGEGKEMVVTTNKAHYFYTVNLYTKVITTAEEFKNMATYMNRSEGDLGLWQYTGYVILGNDIDLSGETFSMFQREAYDPSVSASGSEGNKENSFNGVFDGKGYEIKNYTAGNGLFNTIGLSGIIRNAAFTELSSPSSAKFIFCERFSGRIEDVYVSINSWDSGTMFHNWYGAGQSMNNVVVNYTGKHIDGERSFNGLNGHLAYSNVYVIGKIGTLHINCDSNAKIKHNDCVGIYSNIQNIHAAELNLNSFRADVWNTEYGIPTIDSVVESNKSNDFNITNIEEFVAIGSSLKLTASSEYVAWELLEGVSGISISGDTLTLAADAPVGEFTVTAKNIFNPNVSKSYTLKAVKVEDNIEKDLGYFEIYGASESPELVIDLSSAGSLDSILSVKVSGNRLGYSFTSGVFAVSKADLSPFTSENITAEILAKRGEDYVMITVSGMVVTKAIFTAEELKNMASYMDKAEGTTGYYKYLGYIVLANDIDLSETSPFTIFNLERANVTVGVDSLDCGFDGTLNGQGYAIKNYTAATNGLFGAIGEHAVITNIALIDVVAPAGVNYIFCKQANPFFYNAGNGILSDIYISIKTWESGTVLGHPYAAGQNYENVVINYTGSAIDGERVYMSSSSGHTTRKNMYFIGDVAQLVKNCDRYSHDECIFAYKTISDLRADSSKDLSAFTASVWEREDVSLLK